jgi:hypothetical protein
MNYDKKFLYERFGDLRYTELLLHVEVFMIHLIYSLQKKNRFFSQKYPFVL